MYQYIYRILPHGHRRSKTIAKYGEKPPLEVEHEYFGPCKGEYNQREGMFKVLGLEKIRECG